MKLSNGQCLYNPSLNTIDDHVKAINADKHALIKSLLTFKGAEITYYNLRIALLEKQLSDLIKGTV